MSRRRRSPRLRTALCAALLGAMGSASAAPLKSAIWWDPAESGWGVYIADQGSTLALFWFTYDNDGEPAWFLAPTAPQADGRYTGTIERITGVPLAQIVGQAADPGVTIGNATVSFVDDYTLDFNYTVNGQSQTKQLTRFAFGQDDVVCDAGPSARAGLTNYSDIWWNPASSGWGIYLTHIGDDLYATWYTYDNDREPLFLQGVTSKQADGSFSGELYRSRNGTPFLDIDGAPAGTGSDVIGSMRLVFSDGQNATFQYTIGGVTQTKTIQRFVFGSTANVCAVAEYGSIGNGGGGGGGTSGDDCMPPYAVGDVREVRFDEGTDGAGQRTERIVGTGQFEGQQALVQEVSGQTSAGNGMYARNYLQNGDGTLVSFGAEAYHPTSGALISRSVNSPIRIEMPRAFSNGQSHELNWTVNSSAQGFNTSEQLRSKYTLLGRESVTVEAGTFQACKFAIETDLDSSVSAGGFNTTVQVRRTGFEWTSPQFGMLRREDSGTSTVTTPVGTTTTPVAGELELISATVGGASTR
ncbi:MAG: hypothetical protein KDJ14_00515 [Xanthomonadales bacterium]|nr:hypothetical protein [Xanthomonadales bacterium]